MPLLQAFLLLVGSAVSAVAARASVASGGSAVHAVASGASAASVGFAVPAVATSASVASVGPAVAVAASASAAASPDVWVVSCLWSASINLHLRIVLLLRNSTTKHKPLWQTFHLLQQLRNEALQCRDKRGKQS